MARRTVSTDIKARIPVLYLEQGQSVEEICEILGVSGKYGTARILRLDSDAHSETQHTPQPLRYPN